MSRAGDRSSEAGLREKLLRARGIARELGSVLVAFSGGVDSTLALKLCHDELGARCVAATGRSASLPPSEAREAERLAGVLGVRHLFVVTGELDLPGYRLNGADRCYLCKREVMGRLREVAVREGCAHLVDGTNADDLARSDRPGIRACLEASTVSILARAGLSKGEVREALRQLGVDVWRKPATACLSSRITGGEEITELKLARVAAAEAALVELGLTGVRVRSHGDLARVELAPAELELALTPSMRGRVARACRGAGFAYATLDLEGYRAGGRPMGRG